MKFAVKLNEGERVTFDAPQLKPKVDGDGELTMSNGHEVIAIFARGLWSYVCKIVDEPAESNQP